MFNFIDESTAQHLRDFRREVQEELAGNILPFYAKHAIDYRHGGFHGYIGNDLVVARKAPKGLVQTTRILWTFARAGQVPQVEADRAVAERARAYTVDRFWDSDFGGLYWMLDFKGKPVEPVKMIYGQAFGIYALAEHFMTTGDRRSLDTARAIYDLVERHGRDRTNGGYFEACRRDWTLEDARNVDGIAQPFAKSTNTHLHLLEAYANLLRASPDGALKERLHELVRVLLDQAIDTNSHFILHFDAKWRRLGNRISYGHDIEGSWLLVQAAEVLGDAVLLAKTQSVALNIARATLAGGIDADGGVVNMGGPDGVVDRSKDWWPQAEAMVGFLNAFQMSSDRRFLEQSLASWRFVKRNIIDRKNGEWFWGVTENGAARNLQKTGPWKAPYHNGRACMEVMRRVESLTSRSNMEGRTS